jgi:CRISPR-associated protein Cmr6
MRTPILHLRHKRASHGQHAGLLLQRYLCENATGETGNPEEKRAILQAAINAAANADVRELYKLAFTRWKSSLPESSVANDLQTLGRLIVGLGSENVLETGIRLHHNYGMPIIPGSALKGLAAHYCDQVWGETEVRFKKGGPFHELLFGTTDDSGCIVFHDAWFVPGSEGEPLKLDVMTPHHPKWLDGTAPPTDFDGPTPVPFLSVAGKFHVAVSWRGPASKKSQDWTELSLSLVADALNNWGVGGKTTSGYGRLAVPPPPPPPPAPRKRNSGDRAKVTIIAPRPKGGFDVQDTEPGRNPGALTVGSPPTGTDTSIGAVVDVLVHNDDPRKPQYRWPQPAKK